MTQQKKVLKAKEPVSLRFKVLAKGSKSLYLDTYWNGTRHYEEGSFQPSTKLVTNYDSIYLLGSGTLVEG